MKYSLPIFLFLLFTFSQVISQDFPTMVIQNDRIQDLIIVDNETFYSSTTDIIKIDAENNKVNIDDRTYLKSCQDGKFYKQNDGWIYLGWDFVEYDLLLPKLLIREYDGEILTPSSIDLQGQLNGGFFNSAVYVSMDSIYILNGLWEDYQILRVNANSEIKETIDLDLEYLEHMILMEDNTILIKGISALYTFHSNEIRDEITFDLDIKDINYYPNNRIEVLTNENIYWLDDKLNIQTTIPLLENSRTPKALYTTDDIIYLVEIEDDTSFVTSIDSSFNITSEFIEIPGIQYSDIRIFDNKFAIWGRNKCGVLSSILKLDTDGVDYEIPTVDISLDELIVNFKSSTLDSILEDGVWEYFTTHTYAWELTVTNIGEETIDFYEVISSNFDSDSPRYINFEELTPLEAGESRIHTGEIVFVPFSAGQINFFTWIGTNKVDSNCTDNRIQGTIIVTSTAEKEIADLMIYPNPAYNEIWVDYPDQLSIKIFDVNGSQRLSQNNYQKQKIDISELPSGMYYMEILASGIKTIKKFVKY